MCNRKRIAKHMPVPHGDVMNWNSPISEFLIFRNLTRHVMLCFTTNILFYASLLCVYDRSLKLACKKTLQK